MISKTRLGTSLQTPLLAVVPSVAAAGRVVHMEYRER